MELGVVSITYLRKNLRQFSRNTKLWKKEHFTIRKLSHNFRKAQTVHNFSHSVNMAAALVVFENERIKHQMVIQPQLEDLDDLRVFLG